MNDARLFAILNAIIHGDMIGAEQMLSQVRAEAVGGRELQGEEAAMWRTGADMPVMAGRGAHFVPEPHEYAYATEPEREQWDNRAIMDERIRALEARVAEAEKAKGTIVGGQNPDPNVNPVPEPPDIPVSERQRRAKERAEREHPEHPPHPTHPTHPEHPEHPKPPEKPPETTPTPPTVP